MVCLGTRLAHGSAVAGLPRPATIFLNVQNRVVEVKRVIGLPIIIDVGNGILGKHGQDCLDLVGIQRCAGSVQKSEPRRCSRQGKPKTLELGASP